MTATLAQDIDLRDSQRDRSIPVRLWSPVGDPRGWVLFSVGFGGDRSGYAYLGRAWSAAGIAVAVIEHIGSNLQVLKGFPQKTRQERNREVVRRVSDPAELAARPRDMVRVWEHLAPRYASLPLGIGGHSFGTYTALAALGLPTVPVLPRMEASVTGAVSILVVSPQPPGMLIPPRGYAQVNLPTLVLTGTRDDMLDGEGDHQGRQQVYDQLAAGTGNLVVLDDLEHMTFAGIGLNIADQIRSVASLTTAWWETSLLDDVTCGQRAQILRAAGGPGDYR